MSAQPLPPRQLPEMPRIRQSIGTIALGLILMLVGIAWILDVLDVVNLSLGMILPTALLLVGVALLAGSMSGSHGGLIALGIVLTVFLSGAAAADIPLNGGVGDHSYRPVTITDLQDRYQLAVGNMSLDLRDLDLPPGETTIETRAGLGQITIDVPPDTAFKIHWIISGGNINVANSTQDGTSLDDSYASPGFAEAERKLIIEARMGFGNIDVRQP